MIEIVEHGRACEGSDDCRCLAPGESDAEYREQERGGGGYLPVREARVTQGRRQEHDNDDGQPESRTGGYKNQAE